MDKQKNNWIESVMSSLEGYQKAKPRKELFTAIERRLNTSESRMISMMTVKLTTAAAIALVVFNIVAFNEVKHANTMSQSLPIESNESMSSLISNYNIYES